MFEILKDLKKVTCDEASQLNCDEYVYVKSGKKLYRISLDQDGYPDNPRDWENLCKIISFRGDWDISDRGMSFSRDDFRETVESLEKDPDIFIKPVYMYDHSGQTISLRDFGDRWDSGICGFIYADKCDVLKWFAGATEENWKELALKDMEIEIEVYNDYITGDVYGFEVYEAHEVKHERLDTGDIWFTTEWESVDSCCGFFGSDIIANGLWDAANELFDDDAEYYVDFLED